MTEVGLHIGETGFYSKDSKPLSDCLEVELGSHRVRWADRSEF